GARLPDDQLPGSLAFRALADLHVPEPGDRRNLRLRGRDRREAFRVERIRCAARAARVLSIELAVLYRRLDFRTVFIETEHEPAVVELTGRRRHFLVAVEERALDVRARPGDLKAERHFDRPLVLSRADDDGGIPEAG